MKNSIRSIILVLLVLVTAKGVQSQNNEGSSLASQSRTLTNFNFIMLNTSAEVYVRQDAHYNIEIEAPEEWIDKITTDVSENTLQIDLKPKSGGKHVPVIKIFVSMPKPNGFQLEGSGDIITQNNITTDYMSLLVNGSGSIKAQDISTQKLMVQLNGSGDISQKNSIAENALIELNGSGGIYGGNVMGKVVSVSLSGSGEIRLAEVSGEKVMVVNSGSGSIKQTGGVASIVVIENSGSGNVNAGDLNAATISALNEGSGDIIVGTSETFEAQVTGSGDIHYKGIPKTMRKDITGSGNISPR